jgi:hypothetical protein
MFLAIWYDIGLIVGRIYLQRFQKGWRRVMSIEVFDSQNFSIQFDDSQFTAAELPQVKARAQFMVVACETDLATLCGWFNVEASELFGPQNPTVLTLTKNVRGASNSGYSKTNRR